MSFDSFRDREAKIVYGHYSFYDAFMASKITLPPLSTHNYAKSVVIFYESVE